jgi:NAD(P)-dependent dehydrogenase (short-subunit alcohol dehydrogenase family)
LPVLALKARGAEVLIVTADVSDRDQVSPCARETRARFGGLHGVIRQARSRRP